MAKMDLTANRLRELLHYDQNTGSFTWKVSGGWRKVGGKAGGGHWSGYVYVSVDGKKYAAHRLAFLYVTGIWPNVVDHINGCRDDNRWSNLRDVTLAINNQNTHTPRQGNKNGVIGVQPVRSGRYAAQVMVGTKLIYAGTYDTVEQASEAYKIAKAALHVGAVTDMDRVEASKKLEEMREARKLMARSHSTIGLRGVTRNGRNFRAALKVGGMNFYLGTYATPELAHAAYLAAKLEKT